MKILTSTVIVVAFVALVAFMWTPGAGYQPAVEKAGYTNIEMGTYTFFHCPKGEVGYDFSAAINGERVEGVVCRSNPYWGSYQVRTL